MKLAMVVVYRVVEGINNNNLFFRYINIVYS